MLVIKLFASFVRRTRMPMKTKRSLRIPNDATCVTLKLTYELACYRCETSIAQGINRDILKCNKPWEHKWGNHRLMKYVHKYHAVRNFLSLPNEDDEIVDAFVYGQKKTQSLLSPSIATPESSENITQLTSSSSSTENSEVLIPSESTSPPTPSSETPLLTQTSSPAEISTNSSTVLDGVLLQSKKKEATELWSKIENVLIKFKELHNLLPQSPSIPTLNALQIKVESILDPSQICTEFREGGEGVLDKNIINIQTTQRLQPTTKRTQIIYKPRLARYQQNERKWYSVKKALKLNKYCGSEQGNRLLGTAMSMIPKAGYAGFATALPIAVAGVLVNAGFSLGSDIVSCLPNKDKMSYFMTERAVDSIVLLKEALRKNYHVYIFADKGNKNGNKNLAKYLAWCDKEQERVRKYLIDVDFTNKDSSKNVLAIQYAIKRV